MKVGYIASALALCAATPALADKYFAVTPSGAAETLFPDEPATVVGKLSSKCIDARWTVTTSSPTELVCEAPMSFGQSLLGTLAMGNSYSTPPRRFFRFNVALIDGISRVQASGWMELQMAFGQMKRTDFSGPDFQNGMINFMSAAGGKLPPGTTFPNHVLMGVSFEDGASAGSAGLQVKSVEPGSPAAIGGLQVGDIVTSVARKRLKNSQQYLDAAAKAAETPQYEVQALRDGKQMQLTLNRQFRPAVTETVVAVAKPSPGSLAPSPIGAADELAKLAKLKDQGIITAEEFATQKKRLLGN